MGYQLAEHDEPQLFQEGIRLFNAGEWFDAHEVWEDAWRMAEGEKKRFLQGLIQCAVVLEHARRGNPRGVRAVWGTCVPKFAGLDRVYMGIDTRRLLETLETVVRPILELPESRFDPALPRGQDLPFDRSRVPTIELEYDPFTEEGKG